MVEIQTQVPLAPHTTIGVGGPAAEFVIVKTEIELISALDYLGPVLLLGGGSNLLISDSGFAGRVIKIETTGISDQSGIVDVAAGENWDDFVSWGVATGYGELAPLTGIPGTVGATPIQNVGAYGTEVSELIDTVKVYDRELSREVYLSKSECNFSYRDSIFKEVPDRFVVLSVQFKLTKTDQIPIKYDELATKLNVSVGDGAAAKLVMQAVRELRASKGMVLNPTDRDTYSVGSFFLNPRVSAAQYEQLPREVPAWQQPDGSWKISAAWLISQSGFERGYRSENAAISTKHTLAICNLGNATFDQIMDLANLIRSKVQQEFGLILQIEPKTILNS
jgi:UDP-N-acetylmuramate dehydrogenase